MDPNETLRRIRSLVLQVEKGDQLAVASLADHVRALDHWISAGGFLPNAWMVPGPVRLTCNNAVTVACCTFHDNDGTRELACGGDEPNENGKHSRDCARLAGGDCTCVHQQLLRAGIEWDEEAMNDFLDGRGEP